MITVSPQLAMVAGLMKRLGRAQFPIIAYIYNLGGLSVEMRQRLARFVAQAINAFVVHSSTEVAPYAAYLGVSYDRIGYRKHLIPQECHVLLARARLSATTVANFNTGQITFVNAMRPGVPVVTTRCPGSGGYIMDGKIGRLVAPFGVKDMAAAISTLWQNESARAALSLAALQDA